MIEYLKKLFTTWFLYLGFLPTIYDYIAAYFDWDLKLPLLFVYIIVFLAFLIASYTVWRDEKKAKDDLLKRMANPVEYHVFGELAPIDFEVEKHLKRIDDNVSKAKKEINSANEEIKQSFDNENMGYAFAIVSTNSFNTYKSQLLSYIDQLSDYMQKQEKYKNEYVERVNSLKKKYFIVFNIENIGIKSDSQINIEIKTENNSFIEPKQIYEALFKNAPKLPIKPESLMQAFDQEYNFRKIISQTPLHDVTMPDFSSVNVKFNTKSISIIIKEMNVGQVKDTMKKLIFIELLDEKDFQISIHSKESSSVIEKSLEVKFNNTAKKLMKYA